MKLVLGTASCLAILIAAGGAHAAQRFAAPEGKGAEPCAQATPCSLKDALGGAKAGDEVILGPGSYTVSPLISATAKDLYVHGDFSSPMPKVIGSTPGSPLVFAEAGQHIAYLELTNTAAEFATGFFCGSGARIERVRVVSLAASYPTGILVYENCRVRDSVVRAQGMGAIGLVSNGGNSVAVARNVTVLASGPESKGVEVGGSTHALDLRNAIFGGDSIDLRLTANSKAFVGSSNFDSSNVESGAILVDAGANQTAAPLFVDPAKGDYREAAGSPTIDAGVDDQLGALDLAGNARILGAAVDIGAFELVPPPANGGVRTIRVDPKKFRARRSGGPVAPGILRSKPPVGADVTYTLTGPATVEFSVSHKVRGRRVGKACKRKSRANAGHRKCAFYVPVRGVFTQSGSAGANHFAFSGRIGGRTLRRGDYRLSARAGHLVSAPFTIVGSV